MKMCHVKKVESVNSLANVTLESFKNWTLCLARNRFHLPFVGQIQVSSLQKTLLIQAIIDPAK